MPDYCMQRRERFGLQISCTVIYFLTVSKINLWNFNKKGIYLYLPPYEEGGWMSTSRDFSYEEMNEFLTPFGKSLR